MIALSQMAECILTAWDFSMSVIALETESYAPIPMFSKGLLIGKSSFQEGVLHGKNFPFHGTLLTSSEDPHYSSTEHRRSHCKQDECSSLPCSAV